jgi:hypothetical protein
MFAEAAREMRIQNQDQQHIDVDYNQAMVDG